MVYSCTPLPLTWVLCKVNYWELSSTVFCSIIFVENLKYNKDIALPLGRYPLDVGWYCMFHLKYNIEVAWFPPSWSMETIFVRNLYSILCVVDHVSYFLSLGKRKLKVWKCERCGGTFRPIEFCNYGLWPLSPSKYIYLTFEMIDLISTMSNFS